MIIKAGDVVVLDGWAAGEIGVVVCAHYLDGDATGRVIYMLDLGHDGFVGKLFPYMEEDIYAVLEHDWYPPERPAPTVQEWIDWTNPKPDQFSENGYTYRLLKKDTGVVLSERCDHCKNEVWYGLEWMLEAYIPSRRRTCTNPIKE